MLRTFVLAIALSLTAATAANALPPQPPPVDDPFGQGNAQERAACHPDVMRFCKELVSDDQSSDIFAILSCLQTNRSRISGACRRVLVSHGQ